MNNLATYPIAALLAVLLGLTACSTVRSIEESEAKHRFFVEVDQPGLAAAALYSTDNPGAFVRLLEIDATRTPGGDTLTAWVQHANGIKPLSPHADEADLVIACFREYLPAAAQAKHVLPSSKGTIYLYMMRGGILAISNQRIPYYEVLVVPGGSVSVPLPQALTMAQ